MSPRCCSCRRYAALSGVVTSPTSKDSPYGFLRLTGGRAVCGRSPHNSPVVCQRCLVSEHLARPQNDFSFRLLFMQTCIHAITLCSRLRHHADAGTDHTRRGCLWCKRSSVSRSFTLISTFYHRLMCHYRLSASNRYVKWVYTVA